MRRFAFLLAVCSLLAAPKTKNIVLVTADGLRWQELFNGIDPLLMSEESTGMKKAQALRDKLWRETAAERRAALMPFFWKQLAPQGVVLRNIQVSNAYRVSYPGYSEILTGRSQDEAIRDNTEIQNPTETVLEFAARKLGLQARQVALFGSWNTFNFIGARRPGSIFINAGFQDSDVTPRIAELSRIQQQMLTPWDGARHDYITFEMALDYLRVVKPRLLYLALDETDDWAHDKRYDQVLRSIVWFDRCLETLWKTIESSPEYRGSTTLIVTADHGRGGTLEDWHGHGQRVAGAEKIWFAMIGPDTPPTGESPLDAWQRDIAPTILELLGLDYRQYEGVKGKPIR
ncbi:MAG: sulfatase-like hydrolase/transferase, partial [Candidatus Solibacter usitatus]|nr:sulfatase-like hydrolase/transferase [Candidatus Solibacter usitatus]